MLDEEAFAADAHAGCWGPEPQDLFDNSECVLELVDEIGIVFELISCADTCAENMVELLTDFG